MTTIETELKKCILARYKSLREFSRIAEIPYTTVFSILERGLGRASIDTVMRICDALNLDVDALMKNEIKEKAANPVEDFIPNSKIGKNTVVSIGRGGKRTIYELSDEDASLVDAFLNRFKKE